jgi:hypothetical protein
MTHGATVEFFPGEEAWAEKRASAFFPAGHSAVSDGAGCHHPVPTEVCRRLRHGSGHADHSSTLICMYRTAAMQANASSVKSEIMKPGASMSVLLWLWSIARVSAFQHGCLSQPFIIIQVYKFSWGLRPSCIYRRLAVFRQGYLHVMSPSQRVNVSMNVSMFPMSQGTYVSA